jgi:hypothetical protein
MTRRPAIALALVALLTVAACGGAAAPSTDSSPLAGQASSSPTTLPPATASPDPTASPTTTSDGTTGLAECTQGAMPNLDTRWKFVKGGGESFGLAYPDDWDDLSGEGNFTAASLLDEQTFAELGLATDASVKSDFLRAPEGLPNLSVFRFGPVDSSTATIHDRMVARYDSLPDIDRILDPSVEGCLGGTLGSGVSLEFRSTDGNAYYQQTLFGVRDGELYVVQWLDRLDPDLDLLASILTTWGWIPAFAQPGGSGGIAEANMASKVDESAAAPDPSTFVTSFPTDAPAIYVVYRPDPGADGTVNLSWFRDGAPLLEATLDVTTDTPWAWGGITPGSGGFRAGNYEVKLELNGNVTSVRFTVEAAG